MAEVVNLRLARKAKRRTEGEALANANRAKFGVTKAERAKVAAEAACHDRTLDGAKRER